MKLITYYKTKRRLSGIELLNRLGKVAIDHKGYAGSFSHFVYNNQLIPIEQVMIIGSPDGYSVYIK